MILTAKIVDGRLIYSQPSVVKKLIDSLEGSWVYVTIAKPKSKRSLAANSYLWGVVYKTIEQETGNDSEEIHEFCKLKFNAKHIQVVNKITGEIEESVVGGSTAKMNTDAFWEYIEKVRAFFGTEYGIRILSPNEVPEDVEQ